jgi:hypothetical protein
MFGHRKLANILNGCVAVAACVLVAMVAIGCSTQQTQSSPPAQNQISSAPPINDLPEVASLSDYMAEGSNDNPFFYPSAGPNDPLMIEPLWFQPCWYPVPVYYVYYPVSPHQHLPPPTRATGITPSPPLGTRSLVASAAVTEPARFGGFGGRLGGMGFAHPTIGRR